MGMVTSAQLIAMVLSIFKDQYGESLLSKILWVFRRLLFFMRSWFFDIFYYSIKLEDLEDALEDWKTQVLDDISYLPEVFDCDDFAQLFKIWLMQWAKNNLNQHINGVGLALGVVSKEGRILGGHAWNIVLVSTDEGMKLVYVEPQLGEIIEGDTSSDGFTYTLQAVIF